VSDDDLAAQATTFTGALDACLAVDACRSFTVWGATDDHSWIGDLFPGHGTATLLDGRYRPKPAYLALADALGRYRDRP
jgi:endo-1,4-beta-xylanase